MTRCQAETRRGGSCEGVAVTGLDVCHSHLDQSDIVDDHDDSDHEQRPVWDRAAEEKLRTQPST